MTLNLNISMKAKMLRTLVALLLLTLASAGNARTYLVSVGVADYTAFPGRASNLKLTTKDAKTMVEVYSQNADLSYVQLLDSEATKDRVVRAIGKVFSNAGPDDIVVFFFSGHGYPGGFCAYDGTLSYGEVRKAMARSRSKNKMMFVDACRSGGMRGDSKKEKSAVNSAKNASVMLFLSSRTDENSIECPSMANGFFTTYLNKGLKGSADADNDRVITAKELFDYVHHEVVKLSRGDQHPVMWGKFDKNMPVMKW